MKTNVFAEKSGPVAAKIPLCCGLRLILPEQKWIRDSAFCLSMDWRTVVRLTFDAGCRRRSVAAHHFCRGLEMSFL